MERSIYQKTAIHEENHWWFVGRRRIVDHMLSRLPLNPQSNIAEIGCGTGGNLELLSNYGNVTGIEMDEEACDYSNQRQIAPVLRGSLPYDIPFSDMLFDLIVMMDVLEHVDEDEKSLQNIRDYLQTDGYLLITVPACQFLRSTHDDLHHHKRRYTKTELKRKILSAGYRIIVMSYYNTFLFPLIAGLRIVKNYLKIKGEDDLEMPYPFINDMLGNIFASERYFLPFFSLPFGVSLLAVAHKIR